MTHYIDIKEVAKKLTISVASAWRYTKKSGFPASYKLSAGCTRWSEPEIDNWVQQRRELAVSS